MKLFFNIGFALVAFLVVSSLYEKFIPSWVPLLGDQAVLVAAVIAVITAFVGPSLFTRPWARTVLLWTSPIWVWSFARWILSDIPFVQEMLPAQHVDEALSVMGPSLVAIFIFVRWYSTRWQEISRTALMPLVMGFHLFAVAVPVVEGTMSSHIWALSFGSLSVTFLLSSIMNQERGTVIRLIGICFGVSATTFTMILAAPFWGLAMLSLLVTLGYTSLLEPRELIESQSSRNWMILLGAATSAFFVLAIYMTV